MGLFRSAMGLVRGRAGKDREQAAAELPNEQARTVKAQPVVAREVKREARPDPDKPGWGRAIGYEIGKARRGPRQPGMRTGLAAWPGRRSTVSAARSPPWARPGASRED